MTLYEINDALLNFEYEIDEETGEVLNFAELDSLMMARDEKLENIALYIKNLRAEQTAILEEATKQKARADRRGKKADSLEKYLAYALDGTPFSTPRCDVTWRKSSRVDVINDLLVPDDYCSIKVDRKPDKMRIKKALKSGVEVNGCVLVETNNINVK